MGLKCGIVGLPNVGKSTLFNCLTSTRAQAANFPFCTIEPNLGMITVPDDRLALLTRLVKPQSSVPATVEIVDIAGLVKGASKGEGLGNRFLANIRETHAIVHVLRCFEDDNIVHVDGAVDPVRDKGTIETELLLADLETITKRLERVEKAARIGTDKEARKNLEVLELLLKHVESGKPVRTAPVRKEDRPVVDSFFLLTDKPVLYVCNVDEKSAVKGNEHVEAVREAVRDEEAEVLVIAAATESEIAQLETFEERKLFLEDMGLEESGVSKLIRAAYSLLNLKTFFTAGEKEVRAWTFYEGMTAPQTAGVIHSDFEKGFIRAEVIRFDDFREYGSEQGCRDAGKMSVEGKDYVVKDGDVMHFRFNV